VHQTLQFAQAAEGDPHARTYLQLLVRSAELASQTADELYERVVAQLQTSQQRQVTKCSAGSVAHTRQESGPRSADTIGNLPSQLEEPAILADIRMRNPDGRRELILLVEDDTDVAENVVEMLAQEGFRVILAGNGSEALRAFRQVAGSVNLVILDFLLPDIRGDALFQALRSIDPKVNVLLGSGFLTQGVAGLETLETMRLAGLSGFVPKPYTRCDLLEQVSTSLEAASKR